MARLKAGLLLNPLAGLGGAVGLKGSDGVHEEAMQRGAVSKVADRVRAVLEALPQDAFDWVTVAGDMGGRLLTDLGIPHELVYTPTNDPTTPDDTRQAVQVLADERIDMLLFAGGDGTARDVADAYSDTQIPAVLGIPCGVKMHSGVFASSPRAAAALLARLTNGEMLAVIQAEVRDIDESAFRDGVVKTRFYGELPVPDDVQYMQQTKVGGKESDELVVEDIGADFQESMLPDVLYLMGSGSTVAGVMAVLGLPSTLLGIDAVLNHELIAADVAEQELLGLLEQHRDARIVVTAIGAQGHVFGRGNQQLSSRVIRAVGLDQVQIVATKGKINSLDGRPMLVDTGDATLDAELAGLRTVITGYEDRVIYRVQ